MTPADIIPNLLDIAAEIFVMVLDRHRQQQIRHNQAAADLMMGVGDTLNQVADHLQQDQYPAACCGRLREYAQLMPSLLSHCLDEPAVERYSQTLLENYQVEQLLEYFGRIKPHQKEIQLEKLRSAAGAFHVASEILRSH
jgi:hypothetical protein